MIKKYDLIVPLGYACSCSQTLRRAGLQLASFPWDWLVVPPPSERCRLICNGFKGWMNLEDLKWAGKAFDFKARASDAPAYGIEIGMVANLLKREYRVRDYRTKDEIAAFLKARAQKRREKLARKMEALGAETPVQYWLFRLRRAVRKVISRIGPQAVRARLRQRKYGQIVPLGMNCDVAFRFYCRWGFVDSSLFAWANTTDLATLTAALGQIDTLADGRFEVSARSRMWRHADTGILFHGRLNWDENTGLPPQAELDRDLADLRERLRHLAEKLRRYLGNDAETLVVHRLSDNDASAPDLAGRLDALEDALIRLGARNWKLLVICRASDHKKMPPATGRRMFRCVKAFNPMAKVTHRDLGDPVGWNAIFTEFAPAKRLPKRHAFKFE